MRFFLVEWLQNSRWSIRTKLMSGFFLIVIFLLLLTALSIWTTDHQGQKITEVKTSQDESFGVLQVEHSLVDLKTALSNVQNDLNFVYYRANEVTNSQVLPDEAFYRSQASLDDYDRQRALIQQTITGLDRMTSITIISDTDKNYWLNAEASLKKDVQQLLDSLDIVRQAAGDRQFKTMADNWLQSGKNIVLIITRVENFQAGLNSILENTLNTSRQAVSDADGIRNFSQIILLLAGLLAICLTLIFGLVVTQVFTTPVNRLRNRLLHLADGDLSTNLNVSNQDQFGELANTFNQSIARLGTMVGQVQRQARKVSGTAEEIAGASRHSAQISVEQAGAVTQATVTIEELSHTAQQIAEAATLVANAAEQALNSVNDGQETAQESITGNTNLKLRVREITDRILALSERSQRVGHIIEQVASIADQTHLLALNAAIESAAAGENGKRFAVVASEVKRLADRSRQATKDVQAVLGEIQDATNASVMATEQGMKEAERGVILAYRAGDVNESIIQMVERTVQLANAISLATQQQRSASEQVVASMRHLSTVIGDAAASAQQSSDLALTLDRIAQELTRVSGQFKLASHLTADEPLGGKSGPDPAREETLSSYESSADLKPLPL
jgi:methyl-accepting chemotaxis protein